MRRALVTTLAVPALLFSACSSDEEPTVDEASATATSAQDTESAEETQEATSEEPAEATTEAPTGDGDAAGATSEPPSEDTGQSTSGSGGAGEGGAEGAAAAARTKEFMVALVNADPEICNLILDFQGEGPMKDSPEDLQLCEEILPSTLEGLVGEEEAAVIDVIEVNGAEVNGDTATVDKDNFSDLFAQGFGEESIGLRKVDGEWYVDLDNSFQGGAGDTGGGETGDSDG